MPSLVFTLNLCYVCRTRIAPDPSFFAADIPPLRVVHYPGVDTKARLAGVDVDRLNSLVMSDEKTLAFHPGPLAEKSWSVESNRVPAAVYNHADIGYFK